MYKDKLRALVERNDINEEDMDRIVYQTMLRGVFEVICRALKDPDIRNKELSLFRKRKDHIHATKQLAERYTGCSFDEQECAYLYNLIKAHFRKSDHRISFQPAKRIELLQGQNNQCAICKKTIDISNAHLDHIIPWDYVGDELEDNYQMLCSECNERKGTSSYFEISMLLVNKNR